MPNDQELQAMAGTALAQAEWESTEARARREWDERDAEHVRRATDPVLRYGYPGPSKSSPFADRDARILLTRLEKLRDDARDTSGAVGAEFLDYAYEVQVALDHLLEDWVVDEPTVRAIRGLLDGFGRLMS